ncbi:AbrB/MazE/SpoVT family DNA-binding domain-containing protein [Proteus columbae]|uniref:AbrB/MazE/SpoVT family DNA-binding domain-containing protein n=1 Tax=Proteus columbae TaxID=1987580 RepID=UPI0034D6AC66
MANVKQNLKKWGNSIGIRIPSVFKDQLNLKSDDEMEIYIEGESLVIKKSESSLSELISLINDTNRMSEFDFGHPIGNEVI